MNKIQKNDRNNKLAQERGKITAEMTKRMGRAFRKGRAAARKIDLTDPFSFYRLRNSFNVGRPCWRTVDSIMKQAGVEFEAGRTHAAFCMMQNARHFLGRAIALGRA